MTSSVDVVISGVGAGYPECRNIQELQSQLLDNQNLVRMNEARWNKRNLFGVDPTLGMTKDYLLFDNNFFGMHNRLSTCSNPLSKFAYERTFEAIVDAGMSLTSLRGSNTNVYSAQSICEDEAILMKYLERGDDGYTMMGASRTMLCNRVSYFFSLHGASVSYDGSWASGQLGIYLASQAIQEGDCDTAIVIAGTAALYPEIMYQLRSLGRISDDGLTRSFDVNANGSRKSDALVTLVLQRADIAKRCYAHVVGSMYGTIGPPGRMVFDPTLLQPSGIAEFLRDAYERFGVDPRAVTYLDADASGNQLLEEAEIAATDEVLGVGRDADHPLLVGSVKSNVGMTDAATGLVSVSKLLIAMETGTIPATINCATPNPRLKGVAEGRIRITTENVPITIDENTLMATTSLGLLGTVGHTVLRPNLKVKKPVDPAKELPRLVPITGRTEESVQSAIEKVLATPYDPEYIRLVQDLFGSNIRGYEYRSYVICPEPEGEKKTYVTERLEERPLWFVYSGMGSQWPGMGEDLMRIPIFADTIDRLHNVLLPKGVDLKTILTERGENVFDNILKSFVGITGIQIALTNVLNALEIKPDGIIGHSVGELGCSYADGCLTEEQTILAAYARGKASNDATLIPGMMAAVGLGYKDILPRLPPGVEVACHNSSTSCTLTGPTEAVNDFVGKLTAEGVFARAVNVSNIAYHSQYIQPAAPFLLDYLKKVIPNPKPRSSKWISTSVPESNWETDEAKLCSAEYHTNNLLGSVLFEEGIQKIPKEAVLIEIAPHGLLQAILKRALSKNVNIPMTQRGATDPVQVLLNAVGKMYMSGLQPKVSALYPEIEFPVSRGTASLAPLIGWYHDTASTYLTENSAVFETSTHNFTTDPDGPSVIAGGRELLPLSELISAVCEGFTKYTNIPVKDLSITLRDLTVRAWAEKSTGVSVQGMVAYLRGTGRFEVTSAEGASGERVLLSGFISLEDDDFRRNALPETSTTLSSVSGEEVFADMAARGLSLSSTYKSLSCLEFSEHDWKITLKKDSTWLGVIEQLLQITVLREMQSTQTLRLPRMVQRLEVNVGKLMATQELTARLHLPTNIMEATGLYLNGLTTDVVTLQQSTASNVSPHGYRFVPQGSIDLQSTGEFLALAVQMALETAPAAKRLKGLTVLEFSGRGAVHNSLGPAVRNVLHQSMGVQADVLTVDSTSGTHPTPDSACLTVSGPETLQDAVSVVYKCGGILLTKAVSRTLPTEGLVMLAEQKMGREWLALYKQTAPVPAEAVVVHIESDQAPPTKLPVSAKRPGVLVWRGEPSYGVHDAVEQVKMCPYAQHTMLVFILDPSAPKFSLSTPVYADQLKLGLPVNVLQGGVWGSWRGLPIPPVAPTALSALSLDGVEVQLLGLNARDRQSSTGKESGSGALDYVGVGPSGRVMGVAQWVSHHSHPRLDPLLSWAVPDSWTPEQAATVPCVYSMAFHALLTVGQLQKGQSVLIHEGTSPVGQAALRIATHIGCAPIFTTVANERQRGLLINNFSQLESRHVLSCADSSFEWALRLLTKGRGVKVVFSALPGKQMHASCNCLSPKGRFVHYGREDMLKATKLGTYIFLRSIAMFGLSGDNLFRASDNDRMTVVKMVQEGLDNGVVQPIIGVRTFPVSSLQSALWSLENSECTKAVLDVKVGGLGSRQCSPKAGYLLAGGSAAQCLQVAGWLSLNGARNIVVVPAHSDKDATLQQAGVLSDMFGCNISVLDTHSWDASTAARVVHETSKVAPIDVAIVFVQAKEPESAKVPALLHGAMVGNRDAALVVLSTDAGTAYTMSSLCESRRRMGLRASCLVGPLHVATDLFSRVLGGGTPAVTVLQEANSSREDDFVDNGQVLQDLPRSGAALAALGKALLMRPEPRLHDIQTRGLLLHQATEAGPIFAFPPLGALAGKAEQLLHTLAPRLINPLVCVEGRMEGDLYKYAVAVIKAIRRKRPHGPYTLLGWSLSTPLTLQVARLLEADGLPVVTFLVEGDVLAMRDWARKMQTEDEGESLMSQLLGEDESCAAALRLAMEAKSWASAVSQILSTLPPALAARATHIQSALTEVRARVEGLAHHEPQVRVPVSGKLYVVRNNIKKNPSSLPLSAPNIELLLAPKGQSHLGIATAWLAEALNEFAAYSKMVTEDEVRQMFV